MKVPENINDVQKLIGRLAALNRFISKSAERSLPIFQALKGTKRDFAWGPSQQHAFEEIKSYFSKPNTLTTPTPRAKLLLYVSATESTVSAVLKNRKINTQKDKSLYTLFQKLCLAQKSITQRSRK